MVPREVLLPFDHPWINYTKFEEKFRIIVAFKISSYVRKFGHFFNFHLEFWF